MLLTVDQQCRICVAAITEEIISTVSNIPTLIYNVNTLCNQRTLAKSLLNDLIVLWTLVLVLHHIPQYYSQFEIEQATTIVSDNQTATSTALLLAAAAACAHEAPKQALLLCIKASVRSKGSIVSDLRCDI